jgi:hypothetical protein
MRDRDNGFLGTLGDKSGVNVARVDVVYGWDVDNENGTSSQEIHTGYFHVHATGDEPECEGEDGTIYAVFEKLVDERMTERRSRLGFHWWETEDTRSV